MRIIQLNKKISWLLVTLDHLPTNLTFDLLAGSVQSLRATELQVLVLSTNQNICVRYNFLQQMEMRKHVGSEQVNLDDPVMLL